MGGGILRSFEITQPKTYQSRRLNEHHAIDVISAPTVDIVRDGFEICIGISYIEGRTGRNQD